MRERRSHARYAFDCADGLQVRGYALYDNRGSWLGDVALDYSPARHCLRLQLISDYGNYAYRWDGAGDKGYAAFLLTAGDEYITDKLAIGHDEGRVLLAHETSDAIWETFYSAHAGEDADWLGEARAALMRCMCEADFFAWAKEYGQEDIYTKFSWGWGGYLPGLCKRLLPEFKQILQKEQKKGGVLSEQRKTHDGA